MRDTLSESLKTLKWFKKRKKLIFSILMILSLLVVLDVFWVLRQPALTLAGEASCGILEHTHDETCSVEQTPCDLDEHVHEITCYSDKSADVETPLDWQEMFADYPYTGELRKDLVGIAKTQVGYSESALNFEVDAEGGRHGYTRYGEWYRNPYGDWSAMFVSFCLNYARSSSEETPFKAGADSMARAWDEMGKYTSAGDYVPTEGDIVFFKDNTVGIVATLQNTNFYVIRGDVEDAVSSTMIAIDDASIKGWGITASTASANKKDIDYLDVSDGPAVFIFAGGEKETKTRKFLLKSSQSTMDLISYLEEHNGNYFFTLLDTNNRELPKDDNGNYIVTAGISYKLTITFNNPEGFVPGTYQYHLPEGLIVNGGEGSFILTDKTDVGSWVVTDEGQITMVFNDNINSRTDITISATMGIMFPQQEEPLDFDGKITVTIEEPPSEDLTTKLDKWGVQGAENNSNKADPTKIYWTTLVTGNEGSQIPGSIITDEILKGDHSYTDSDIAAGLHFGVSETDPKTGAELNWHAWTVSADDPNLTWTAKGWTYRMPEQVTCDYCGKVQLGNDGWIYYIEYTSTPNPGGGVGIVSYTNRVTVDGQQAEGWASFTHGKAHADILKHGAFHGDADGGKFLWEIQTTIPGLKEGEHASYSWYIMDMLRIRNPNIGIVDYIENDANLAKIMATNKGKTVTVPNIKYATANDQFSWCNTWSSEHNGINYGRAINIFSRCNCTEKTCAAWYDGSCGNKYWYEADDGNWYYNGFCHCWAVEGDTNFTLSYETDNVEVIEAYGGSGNELHNEAVLYSGAPDGSWNYVELSRTEAAVPIPGVFKKELTHDFNGYTANYKITVNESKLALTDGSPLTIHDEMTETLAFISGSLVIHTEDANGNKGTLQQDVDYTVTYDGTGNEKDDKGKPVHVLDIVILKPQPVTYTLDYDATLIIPQGTTQAIKYSNSATISIWGNQITDTSEEKVHADINIAAKSFRVEMHKKDSQTGEPLGGATFGLFNKQGGLITSDVTDSKGELLFVTNVVQGIILQEHVLYYMQELEAPPGYLLDDTKYWICFCSEAGGHCDTCDEITNEVGAARIPFEQVGKVHVVNEQISYTLPDTGASGVYPLFMISITLILISLTYGFIRRRREERRDTS